MIVNKLIGDEINRIFQSERDRLRNADHPEMMRPKNRLKPLKGLARVLYLEKKAKLHKAEAHATSGLGRAFTKTSVIKKEKEDET